MNEIAENNYAERHDGYALKAEMTAAFYEGEWLKAVTTKPLTAPAYFDDRKDLSKKISDGHYLRRASTVAEIFSDMRDDKDFTDRMSAIVLAAYKAGDAEAVRLVNDMAQRYGESKV